MKERTAFLTAQAGEGLYQFSRQSEELACRVESSTLLSWDGLWAVPGRAEGRVAAVASRPGRRLVPRYAATAAASKQSRRTGWAMAVRMTGVSRKSGV